MSPKSPDRFLSPADVLAALQLTDRPQAQTHTLRGSPELTLRDEGNVITAFSFRNGFLEDLHAGKHSPLLDDPSNSRITDVEMQKLMVEASAQVSRWLYLRELLLEREPTNYHAVLHGYARIYCQGWERKATTVPLRQHPARTPCRGCGEVMMTAWKFCPWCAHPR